MLWEFVGVFQCRADYARAITVSKWSNYFPEHILYSYHTQKLTQFSLKQLLSSTKAQVEGTLPYSLKQLSIYFVLNNQK